MNTALAVPILAGGENFSFCFSEGGVDGCAIGRMRRLPDAHAAGLRPVKIRSKMFGASKFFDFRTIEFQTINFPPRPVPMPMPPGGDPKHPFQDCLGRRNF